jgi:hypothetical protein
MTTEQRLIEKYGSPLLTTDQLAEILQRSPSGLRFSLQTDKSDFGDQLRAARRRLGRRLYFRAAAVAAIIDGSEEQS